MALDSSQRKKSRRPSSRRSKNKFGAIRCGPFGSKTEKLRFEFLQSLERGGVITELRRHPIYVITPDAWPVIKFIPDAQYVDIKGTITGKPGQLIVEDTKGMITDIFRLKVKLFRGKYPDIDLFIARSMSKRGKVVAWRMTDAEKKKGSLEILQKLA